MDVMSSHGFYRGNPNYVAGRGNGMFLNVTAIEVNQDNLPSRTSNGALAKMNFGAFLDYNSDGWLDLMMVTIGAVNPFFVRTGCPSEQGLNPHEHSSRCYRCPAFAEQRGNRCVECDQNMILGPR